MVTMLRLAYLVAFSTALGTSFDELSRNWKAETSYLPKMNDDTREKKLVQWNKALTSVKAFHG